MSQGLRLHVPKTERHKPRAKDVVSNDTPAPVCLKIQPVPIVTRIVRIPHDNGTVWTAISRQWAPGDPERCRLCPKCHAYDGGCLLVVGSEVSDEEAPGFTVTPEHDLDGW